MKNVMKKIVYLFFFFLLLTAPHKVIAADTFTKEEVAKHATSSDCYFIFENNVYAIPNAHIIYHDYNLDIRPWCGKDITADFKTKAGRGKDHSFIAYSELKDYFIGSLVASDATNSSDTTQTQQNASTDQSSSKPKNRYNFYIPILIILLLYIITKALSKSHLAQEKRIFSRPIFDFFWNSVMILGIIPSALFGLYMVFSYSFPKLRDILPFDMLYWHVELSIAFATAVVLHIIQRLARYIAPIKGLLLLRKSSDNENRSRLSSKSRTTQRNP